MHLEQAELHLRVLKLMASGGMERWLTGVTGSSSSTGTGTGLEVVQVRGLSLMLDCWLVRIRLWLMLLLAATGPSYGK